MARPINTLARRQQQQLALRRLRVMLMTLEKDAGLSNQKVAAAAGIAPAQLSNMRTGRNPVTELAARRLGETWGVNYRWLMGESDEKKPVPPKPLTPALWEYLADEDSTIEDLECLSLRR